MVIQTLAMTTVDGPTPNKYGYLPNVMTAISPEYYRFEEHRLKTFDNWPLFYPVDKARLAKAGFHYLGVDDKVECFCCKGKISNWEEGDSPFLKHKTLFPYCKFVKGDSDNVPMVNLCRPPNGYCSSRINAPNSKSGYPITNLFSDRPSISPVNMNGSSSTNLRQHNGDAISFVSQTRNIPSLLKSRHESERLNSFKGWPHRFITPEKLAEAGFYYLHESDKVQCAFCQGIVSNWDPRDDPMMEHKRHFPYCPFIQNKDVNNIPMSRNRWFKNGQDVVGINDFERNARPERMTLNSQNQRLQEMGINELTGPAHISQASIDTRLRSFVSWPTTSTVNTESLAEAGFFFVGVGDFTKCFYCNGGLCSWQPTDIPWIEHARWFPQCAFVQLNKGQEFIKSCLRNNPPQEHTTQNTENRSEPIMEKLAKKVDELMNSTLVKQFLESELFTYQMVQAALLRQLKETGHGFDNEDDLCEAIMFLQLEEENRPSNGEINEATSSVESNIIAKSIIPPLTNGIEVSSNQDINLGASTSKSNEATNGTCFAPIVKEAKPTEDNKPRDTLLCKICMDNEVGMVFLPCGHLLACTRCGPALKECPMCRKTIHGAVRTFLS